MKDRREPVRVEARLSHPLIQAETNVLLFLRIDVSAESTEGGRPPLDLTVVLDRSGSMHGEKIVHARQAFAQVVDHLRSEDQVSLVAYDDVVDVVVPRQEVGTDALVMRVRADTIDARASTNLSAGLIAGLQQLGERGSGIHRVLLLSDGLANQGITDPGRLAGIAQETVSTGRSVSTFGVGQEYNEYLLRALADAGAGSYYYIDSAEAIPQIFLEELGELGQVVAQNLEVDFAPKTARIDAVLGFGGLGLPAQAGDVLAGGTRSVLLALSLSPHKAGEVPLGTLRCRWTPLEGSLTPKEVIREVAAVATTDVTQVEARVDQEVLRAAQLQLAADEHQAAVEAARRGDTQAFEEHLNAGIKVLEALGDDAEDVAPDQVRLNRELRHRGYEASAKDRDLQLRTHYHQYRSNKSDHVAREKQRRAQQAQLTGTAVHLEPWGGRTLPLPPAPGPGTPLVDRVRGMLLGLAIGDALGNTSEGLPPDERAALYGEIRDYLPNRHDAGRRVGLPSDDTQLAFWTLESILDRDRLEPQALAEAFSGRRIYGIGHTVRAFLHAYKDEGRPWYEAGRFSAGNGALMRIAPVLVPHAAYPTAALWTDVITATVLTHRDEAAVAAGVGFVGILAECLARPDDDPPTPEWWPQTFLRYARPVETGQPYSPRRPGLQYEGTLCDFVETFVLPSAEHGLTVLEAGDRWYSGAYLLETLPLVLLTLARHGRDPEEALVRAVNDTRDNDTVGAIVGAATGALRGESGLPERWRDGLLGRTREDDNGRVQLITKEAVARFLSS